MLKNSTISSTISTWESSLGTNVEKNNRVKNLSGQDDLGAMHCLTKQGSNGFWVQDWNYSANVQYDTYPNPVTISSQVEWQKRRERYAQQRFGPTIDAPYRWATSWRWEDKECPIEELITLHGLCELCYTMNISRIHVVGDSMSGTFVSSLLSLVEHGNVTADDIYHKRINITCPQQQQKLFGGSKL